MMCSAENTVGSTERLFHTDGTNNIVLLTLCDMGIVQCRAVPSSEIMQLRAINDSAPH